MVHQERLNGTLAETVKNTLNYASVEVPNSLGAKMVMLDLVEQDTTPPEVVAATTTTSNSIVIAGKTVPTSALLSEPGAVAARHITIYPAAGAATVCGIYTAGEEPMASPVQILPSPLDGKYYVTIAVKGTANAASLMGVRYHMRFRVQ